MARWCKRRCRSVKREWERIHLVDRCLILLMSVLLVQSAYSLVANHDEKGPASDIDIIVRTASASIFGYFLSANFIHRESIEREKTDTENVVEIQALEAGNKTVSEIDVEQTVSGRFQILVAAGIGLFCLTILIILRNVGGWGSGVDLSGSAAATVAQFRDFVSGCVGFLIGSPTGRK